LPLFVASDSEILVFRDYVSTNEDDAEEDVGGSGDVTRFSSDLDFRGGSYNSTSEQRIGVRFTGSAVPAGATVVRAYISFVTAGGGNNRDLALQIWAEADDTGTFGTDAFNILYRDRTSATTYWAFTANPLAGVLLTTPDISEIVQEVIDDPDWNAPLGEEDDMTFIFEPVGDGFGHQEVYSRDGADSYVGRPMLHIEYTVGGAP
jgi:type IV pilus assembly protein PilY1